MWVGRRVLIPADTWLGSEGVEMRVGGRFPDNVIDMLLLQLIEAAYEKRFGPLNNTNPVVAALETLSERGGVPKAWQGFFQKPKWFWSECKQFTDISPLARSLTQQFLLDFQDLRTIYQLCEVGGFQLELVGIAQPVGPQISKLLVRITNLDGKCCSLYRSYTPESFLVLPCRHVAVRYELFSEMARIAGQRAIAMLDLNHNTLVCKHCFLPITSFVFDNAAKYCHQYEETKMYTHTSQCSVCGDRSDVLTRVCTSHSLCNACSRINFLSQNYKFCPCCELRIIDSQQLLCQRLVLEDRNLIRAFERVKSWRVSKEAAYDSRETRKETDMGDDRHQQSRKPPPLESYSALSVNSSGISQHHDRGYSRPQTTAGMEQHLNPLALDSPEEFKRLPGVDNRPRTSIAKERLCNPAGVSSHKSGAALDFSRAQSDVPQSAQVGRCKVCNLQLNELKQSCQNKCLCQYCVLVLIVSGINKCSKCNQPINKWEKLSAKFVACKQCRFITTPDMMLSCKSGCTICQFCAVSEEGDLVCICKKQICVDSPIELEKILAARSKKKVACCSKKDKNRDWLNTVCSHPICNTHLHYLQNCRICRKPIKILQTHAKLKP